MPKSETPIKIKARKCKYCKLSFVPPCRNKQQQVNAENQKFCCRQHKDAYHLHGGFNWERFWTKFEKEVRRVAREEAEAVFTEGIKKLQETWTPQILGRPEAAFDAKPLTVGIVPPFGAPRESAKNHIAK